MSWRPAGPALLFCPADRPDRFAKAAAVADMVILDLEDGVAAVDKPAARAALVASALDPRRTIVRLNPAGTREQEADLAALSETAYDLVMLAKAERPGDIDALAPRHVIALCETPAGVIAAPALASCRACVGLMWGAEDLVASLGGRSSRSSDGAYRGVARAARSQVLLAAGAAGVAAIDAIHLDINDLAGLRREAEDAAASGFAATACIHPNQVEVVRAAYRPSDEEIAWAKRLITASRQERGVFSFEGRMVDAPLLRHAERVLAASPPEGDASSETS